MGGVASPVATQAVGLPSVRAFIKAEHNQCSVFCGSDIPFLLSRGQDAPIRY